MSMYIRTNVQELRNDPNPLAANTTRRRVMMVLKTFRLQLRFLAPLVAVLVAAAYLAVPLMDRVTLRWFSRDLNSRGVLVANALSDSVAEALVTDKPARLRPLFDRTVQDERLVAVGLCNTEGRLLQRTDRFPVTLSCAESANLASQPDPRLSLTGGAVHVGVHDVMGQPPSKAVVPVNPAPGVIPDDAVPSLALAASVPQAPLAPVLF